MLKSVLFATLIDLVQALRPEQYLHGLIDWHDKRYTSFWIAMTVMKARGLKTIVETGTARNGRNNCGGDGCSTVVWSQYAQDNEGSEVYSVDISPEAVHESRVATEAYVNITTVVCSDSIFFLREFDKPIDLLYLDSYDFDWSDPRPSQEHHLKEIVSAYNKLHDNSVVIVDDCGLPHEGKCPLVELFLSQLGWRVLFKGYQLVMVTENGIVL